MVCYFFVIDVMILIGTVENSHNGLLINAFVNCFLLLRQVQGGVVIFDKEGNARYAYEEDTGTPLDMDDIVSALKKIRDE